MVDARVENRNQARHEFLTAIEYILDHPANSSKLHKGVIINVAYFCRAGLKLLKSTP